MEDKLETIIEKIGGNTDELETNLDTDKYDSIIEYLGGNLNELKTNLITEKREKIIKLLDIDIEFASESEFLDYLTGLYPELEKVVVEGENITITDSTASNCSIEIQGNTEQDGEPTPDNPIEIETVKGNCEVEINNKNLFNINTINKNVCLVWSNGSINGEIGSIASDFIKIELGQNYTINYSAQIMMFDKNKEFVERYMDNSAYRNFTITNENVAYIKLGFRKADNQYKDMTLITNIQLEKGSIATEYTPYRKQTIIFPLGEEGLMEDSYLADDGIHHKRKKIVFDGTETFNLYPSTTQTFMTTLPYISLKGISTHYKNIKSNLFDVEIGMYADISSYFIVSDTRFSTVEEFKTYLAEQYANGTPVTLEFIMLNREDRLPIEEIIPYTKEQQIAWKQLKSARTYYGTTYINTNSEIKPTLKVTYKQIKS